MGTQWRCRSRRRSAGDMAVRGGFGGGERGGGGGGGKSVKDLLLLPAPPRDMATPWQGCGWSDQDQADCAAVFVTSLLVSWKCCTAGWQSASSVRLHEFHFFEVQHGFRNPSCAVKWVTVLTRGIAEAPDKTSVQDNVGFMIELKRDGTGTVVCSNICEASCDGMLAVRVQGVRRTHGNYREQQAKLRIGPASRSGLRRSPTIGELQNCMETEQLAGGG